MIIQKIIFGIIIWGVGAEKNTIFLILSEVTHNKNTGKCNFILFVFQ